MNFRTRAGEEKSLDETTIKNFERALRGHVVLPGSAEYDAARTIWNAMIDRRPALIVRCADADDVAHAVRFAGDHDLAITVRGGGHNIAGTAISDGGFMIDLSPMKGIRIDAEERKATIEAGATLGEFDTAAQAFGLATPLGINSTTGVAGLTLGGGFGWLSRKYGLTIDNLVSADIVTAAGRSLKASATENPDLFWAIRGGGGNFGIVTSFEFRLHRVGPTVLSGLVVHPLDAAPDVLRFYRKFIATTPEEFVCWFVLRLAPPLPFLPQEWHGKGILALAMCYSGSVEDGERVASPLRAFGRPIADVVAPNSYAGWQTALDPLLTPGMRNYWKSHDFSDLDDGLIDVLVAHAQRFPHPQSEIFVGQLGGAVSRIPQDATAYTHRDAQFVVNAHGRWDDPADDAKGVAWARELSQAAAPFATGGVYVNFMTQEETSRIHAAYGSNYQRLVELKKKFDPSNLFQMNQNVRPA